MKNLDILTH